uniref:Kinesin-like protein n=1 Tax=Ditylenchus dipsaci TaxID=166011 RepID=A0A915DTJ2_9BILA
MGSSKKAPQKKKNVQVVVRVRPLSEDELKVKCKSVVVCDTVARTAMMKSNLSDNIRSAPQRTFGPFDRVYGPESTQVQIYNEILEPLMKEVLNGYNCTIFAYGQTGSGKTFTMEGRHDESSEYSWDKDPTSGIIPRALHHIFSELGDQEVEYYTVRVSYIEMYNEQIYDLLSTSESSQTDSLRIFDDKNKGVSIVGMEEVAVRNRSEVYTLLKRGAEKRRTASTLMNINSSRSHSVFTMREPGCVAGEELLRQGKLNLVDLAGSENIGRSGATLERAREAGNINVSLLALGRVINSLTTNAQHIPYRESKLTRILQDSLGGKTITTIIATLSPASTNHDESVNTLDYAQRAKNIKNNPECNQKITRKALLKEYDEEIERLRKDLVAMREKNGIYLDKENYDRMLEHNDENEARIEDLEARLMANLYRVKILSEDLQIMDEHYQTVYQKCQRALAKLEARKSELESLHLDLAKTRDNVKAANSALAVSNDAFTRLRSQAYSLQENCAIYHDDLGVMHNRLEELRQVSSSNDHLLGQFAAERIHQVSKGKESIQQYVQSYGDLSVKFKEMIVSVQQKMVEMDKAVEQQQGMSHELAFSLTKNLVDSQTATERFVHQEFQRIQPTGATPRRREPEYDILMEDLPPTAELIKQQEANATPRRASSAFRVRDSILESDFRANMMSPHSISEKLKSKQNLETVDEHLQKSSFLDNEEAE